MRRQDHKFTRKKQLREVFATALIVCEGKETEPNYIKGLIEHLKIHPRRIKTIPAKHSTAVVEYAASEMKKSPGEYDEVFAVFDGDHQGLKKEESKAKDENIQIILSVPCFEVWILLHFKNTDRPYLKCDNVIKDLPAKHGYTKNDPKIFEKLKDLLPTAELNAKSLAAQNEESGRSSPSTDIHLLVEKLRNFSV